LGEGTAAASVLSEWFHLLRPSSSDSSELEPRDPDDELEDFCGKKSSSCYGHYFRRF
jgi:hypothetical protein